MAEKTTKLNTEKLVMASARSLHISPRKMRLVTNLVKNMNALDAVTQLQFKNKKASPMLIKLIKSAVANAEHNFSLDPETLYIKSITCDMGQTMKRFFPRARGSAFVIRRKLCHVNLVLESKPGKKKSKTKFVKATSKPKEAPKPVETDQALPEEQTMNRPEAALKTSEQAKANKIAQKRRPQAPRKVI